MKKTILISSVLALLPTLTSVAVVAQEQPPPCVAEWSVSGAPMDAIADAQQDVYVTIWGNKVLKLDEAGTELQNWGYFNNPRGVAVDSQGFVYVGSWNSGEVSKFDSDGNLVLSWISSGAMYVATDSNDDLWLTSFGDNQVRKFDSEGNFQFEWPVNSVSNPRGIDVDFEGNVYVTEQGTGRVRKFTQGGTPLHTVGPGYAWDVAVDPQNNAYLAESSRVVKYDSDGNYLTEWAGCATGVGAFAELRGIGVSDSGYIYVADLGGARVSVFGRIAPEEQIAALIGDVISLNLQEGIANSLDAKLSSALDALEDVNANNDGAAINKLQSFINAVNAQRGNKISEADADALMAAVQSIVDQLSDP